MIPILPGLLTALALTWAAMGIAAGVGSFAGGGGASPISPITIAIVLGIAVANTLGVSQRLAPGLDFCVKKLLRLGIVLIGLKLSLGDVAQLGATGVPVVMLVIAGGLFFTTLAARRTGVSSGLALLTAAATSICGVTAAVSVAPVIEVTEEELSYAVANVTLYGLIGMVAYPYLAHVLFGAHGLGAGLFLGTAIHDTSQVMGAAISYRDLFHDDVAFKVATITKLTRNVFLVVVVPLLAYWHATRTGHQRKSTTFSQLFPTFVLAFLAMVCVRTTGDLYLHANPAWQRFHHDAADVVAPILLGAALASVGLTTDLRRLRALGLAPLYVGGFAATCVGVLGLALAALAVKVAG